MRPPQRFLLAALALPLAALFAPASSSAAVTLGTQSDQLSQFSTVSVPTGTVFATLSDTRPGHYVTAPESGVVTSWRTYEFSGTSTASLVVLERTAGTDDVRIVSTSQSEKAGDQWFGGTTRLRIAAGQQVGVQVHGTFGFSHFFWGQNVPVLGDPGDTNTGSYAIYENLVPGGPALPPRPISGSDPTPAVVTNAVFQVQAVVEPDDDGDGFGDETQDRCLGLANQDQTDSDRDGQGDVCDTDDDNDGLLDGDEPGHGADPLDPDSDGDGLLDGDEVTRGTDPLIADSDGDSLDDANEVARGTDPTRADSDDDALDDGDEIVRGTDPLQADTDRDGLDDGDEVARGTDPLIADSDGDGLEDGDEVARGTDPLATDSDDDGIDDRTEIALALDPLNADSDGDGSTDGVDGCPTVAGTDGGCPAVIPPAPLLIPQPVPVPVPTDRAPIVAFATPSPFTSIAGGEDLTLPLVAIDDHGVASVEVMLHGRVLCRVTTAPYACRIDTDDGRLVGTNSLVAVVRDGLGQIGTSAHTLTVRQFRPRSVSRSVTVRHRERTTVRTRGTVRRPRGLDAESACEGRVTVRIKRGKVTLSSRRVKLSSACRFDSSVVFGDRVRIGDRLRVQAIFDGNRVLDGRRSKTRTVTVRERSSASTRSAKSDRAERSFARGRSVTLNG